MSDGREDAGREGVVERASGLVSRLLAVASALALAVIVVLLVASSVRRYLLGAPLPVTEEFSALLFSAVSFLAVAEGFRQDRHIRLSLLWRHLPARLQGWAMIAGHVFSLAVILWLAYWTAQFALTSQMFGSRSYVSGLTLWPWMMLIPVSLAALVLAIVIRALADLRLVAAGRPVLEAAVLQPAGRQEEDDGRVIS